MFPLRTQCRVIALFRQLGCTVKVEKCARMGPPGAQPDTLTATLSLHSKRLVELSEQQEASRVLGGMADSEHNASANNATNATCAINATISSSALERQLKRAAGGLRRAGRKRPKL